MRDLPRPLGDGLVLRRATGADADALAEFNQRIHDIDGVGQWTRDLMTRPHPTVRTEDFTIVEHEESGAIVSSLNLIPQTWSYRGIPFECGRIELVGTDPEYRRRGLIRTQMEVVHEWCRERGMPVQGITGVPHYYRRFGYEMAIEHLAGRTGPSAAVPRLEDGEQEPYLLRPATAEDAAFLAELHTRGAERFVVADVFDEDYWHYTVTGRSDGSMVRFPVKIITDRDGARVGMVAWWSDLSGRSAIVLIEYELVEDAPWTLVTPSVLRGSVAVGRDLARAKGKTLGDIALSLGSEHPAYDVLTRFLNPARGGYAWYVRVPDLVGFLRHISPALEWQLANSSAAGHTGELTLSFYDDGVRITLEQGLVAGIDAFTPGDVEDGDAKFPDLAFLHLLFGHRSVFELERIHPDCYAANDAAAAVLDGLFPPGASFVAGIE